MSDAREALEQELGKPDPTWPEPLEEYPSMEEIEMWVMDSVVDATDGCSVEPDGTCQHGYPSWLLYVGLI